MVTEDQEKNAEKELAQEFDELIKQGPWKKSLFLESIGKKLEEVRNAFLVGMRLKAAPGAQSNETNKGAKDGKMNLAEDELLIYVSLYNAAGGDDIISWGKIISNMGTQIISRPIYAKEDEILKFIRSKSKPENEGYACVLTKKTQIMIRPGGDAPKDPLGHSLLVVKEGAIDDKNILKFVHDGVEYSYKDAKLTLIKKSEVEPRVSGPNNN